MKTIIKLLILASASIIGWQAGAKLTPDALGIFLGVTLGLMVGIPMALMAMVANRRVDVYHHNEQTTLSELPKQPTSLTVRPVRYVVDDQKRIEVQR